MPLLAAMAAQAFGIAALSTGDARGAHQRLGPFAEAVPAVGAAEPGLCRFLPDEIEALTRLGDLGPAEALLKPFEARSAELGRGWGIATASRCRGLLLAARGDLDAARGSAGNGACDAPAPGDAFRGGTDAACRRGGSPAGTAQAQGPGVPPVPRW